MSNPKRLSYSKLQTYGQCPLKYKAIYVEGKREPATIHTLYGRAMHKLAEKMYLNKQFAVSEWLESWPAIFEKVLLKTKDFTITEAEKINLIAKGYKHIMTLFPWLHKEGLLEGVIATEFEFLGKYQDHDFIGVIDLILDRGTYHLICDYKFGRTSEDHQYQLMLYAAFYKKISGQNNLKGVLIYPNTIEKSHYLVFDDKLREYGSNYFRNIYNKLVSDTTFAPTKNKYCTNCSVRKRMECPIFESTYVRS